MRNEMTETKLKILQVLYVEQCIPSSQIRLYSIYLRSKGIQVGPTYLYRILRELVTVKYVERIRVGYQQKGVSIKSLEGKSGYKIKNIYRLTAAGRHYVEDEGLILNQELCRDLYKELEGEDTSEDNLVMLKENLVDGDGDSEAEREKTGTRKSTGFVLQSALNNERTVRLLKTELFGKVSEIISDNNSTTYISNENLRSQIKNKGALASKITGLIQICDVESNTHFLPIYNLGGSVGSQSKKTERKMKAEIENKYNTVISEEIVLGENYETLLYNVETYILRKQARKNKTTSGRKARALMIEPDAAHITTKYFHCIDVNGVEQMQVYKIPKEVRKTYYQQRLKEDFSLKEYFDTEAIQRANESELFSSITDTENVYVGYEVNIDDLVQLVSVMYDRNTSKKKLLVVCQESQKVLYEMLFKMADVEDCDARIITTPYYI